jgi:hypothetical protein
VLYVLDCQHVVCADPDFIEEGDKLPCIDPQCHRLRRITGIHVYEWHVKCNVCPWGAWTGTSEALSWQRGRGHTASKQHTVTVSYQKNPQSVIELQRYRRAGVIK